MTAHLKMLILSYQQFKIQRHSVYNNINPPQAGILAFRRMDPEVKHFS